MQQNSESSKGLGQSLQNTEEVSIYRRNERGGKRKIKEALKIHHQLELSITPKVHMVEDHV